MEFKLFEQCRTYDTANEKCEEKTQKMLKKKENLKKKP